MTQDAGPAGETGAFETAPDRGFDLAWRAHFAAVAAALPRLAAEARPVLLGFSAFVDASVRLEAASALFDEDAPVEAQALAAELLSRVAAGRGGEFGIDWPAGDAWLAAHLPFEEGAGGTSVQIARALAMLGAPALLALADRGPAQLGVIDGNVLVAEGDAARRLATIAADPQHAKLRHWIFEARARTLVAGEPVRRSTRTIVRLVDDVPEDDAQFAALSRTMAPTAGAAALSSLVSTPDAMIDATLSRIARLAGDWRRAGLDLVHIELADYGRRPHLPDVILGALRGIVTSVGMSLSEWRVIGGAADVAAFAAFAERHGLARLCIHADDFAVTLTRGDPERERLALATGCLIAGARAAAGRLTYPKGVADAAEIRRPPFLPDRIDDHAVVVSPAPWLPQPASTIGLGDTFLAGTLLVLGRKPGASFLEWAPIP